MTGDNIRFVLVEPSHPGNIGATARALKTMGFNRLALVRPKQFPCAEATARATGADDVLATARVEWTLAEAVAPCTLVVGASARRRAVQWPLLNPRQLAELMARQPAQAEIAIVFGREHSGLTNRELDVCHYLVNIPANPEYPSLNLAAAVQVVAYELRMARLGKGDADSKEIAADRERATVEDMLKYYEHLNTTLVRIGFIDPARPGRIMRRLQRLFNRAGLDKAELNILRGWLTATLKLRVRNGSVE